jgi:hypothetical protein
MGCNCKMTESILAILIVVFALWMTPWSQWIVVIAGAVLLIHSLACKSCKMCGEHEEMKSKKKRR